MIVLVPSLGVDEELEGDHGRPHQQPVHTQEQHVANVPASNAAIDR